MWAPNAARRCTLATAASYSLAATALISSSDISSGNRTGPMKGISTSILASLDYFRFAGLRVEPSSLAGGRGFGRGRRRGGRWLQAGLLHEVTHVDMFAADEDVTWNGLSGDRVQQWTRREIDQRFESVLPRTCRVAIAEQFAGLIILRDWF